MPDSLADLEQLRASILTQILQRGDFRSGSITSIKGRCGKPTAIVISQAKRATARTSG